MNSFQTWNPWAGDANPVQQGMNVAYDIGEQAYRALRNQGLSDEQARVAVEARMGRGGSSRDIANLWDLNQRPVYSGPPAWNFQVGNGLDTESTRRARMTEQLVVDARNQALAARRQTGMRAGVTPQLPPQLQGRAIGVDDGLGFDPMAFSGGTQPLLPAPPVTTQVIAEDPWAGSYTAPNSTKINSTLAGGQQQSMQLGSGGVSLEPLQAGMAAADLATSVLPLSGGAAPHSPSLLPQPVVARSGYGRPSASVSAATPVSLADAAIDDALGNRDMAAGSVNLGLDAPVSQRQSYGSDLTVDTPNVSGGGPGTSSAKGNGTIERQTARRAAQAAGGTGILEMADAALGSPDLGIGRMAQKAMQRAGAAARQGGMRNLGNALFRAGGAARVLAPVAAVGGAVLPAAMGAMEGYEQAGAGGAVIQGGAGAAGALAGGAIGTAILPGIGTVIGAGIGSMVGSGAGSGLTGLAQGAVEKAQQGDTGFMGGIGRALDPLIDTTFEKEQKAALQQMNSPAMRAIQDQERLRRMEAQSAQNQQMFMQAALQGLY